MTNDTVTAWAGGRHHRLVLVENYQCCLRELGLSCPELEVLELDSEFVAGGAVDRGPLRKRARDQDGLVGLHEVVVVVLRLGGETLTIKARAKPELDELLPRGVLANLGDDHRVVPWLAMEIQLLVGAAGDRNLGLLGELDHPAEDALGF